MTPTIAEIAAGLSEAQRKAVTGRILHISKRDRLVEAGLLTPDGGRNWTPLGIQLRDFLREKEAGRG